MKLDLIVRETRSKEICLLVFDLDNEVKKNGDSDTFVVSQASSGNQVSHIYKTNVSSKV